MIHLTRLNNQPLIVNADLIKFIENVPDTVITLLNGEKIVVRESANEVLERIRDFQRRFYRRMAPGIDLLNESTCSESGANDPPQPSKPPDDTKR
jgi:flagellar protein FlbD